MFTTSHVTTCMLYTHRLPQYQQSYKGAINIPTLQVRNLRQRILGDLFQVPRFENEEARLQIWAGLTPKSSFCFEMGCGFVTRCLCVCVCVYNALILRTIFSYYCCLALEKNIKQGKILRFFPHAKSKCYMCTFFWHALKKILLAPARAG